MTFVSPHAIRTARSEASLSKRSLLLTKEINIEKQHTVSGRMNKVFHACVFPLASDAFLSSTLCCLNVCDDSLPDPLTSCFSEENFCFAGITCNNLP
nr:hypothetical protein Iba_chr09cCG5230 [Ipomoea batatas]